MAPASRLVDSSIVVLVAATVFAFAAGSSSVHSVHTAGHSVRWVVLLALLVAAGVWVLASRAKLDVGAPLLAASTFVGLALLSAAWSVVPRLSVERGVSVGLVLATAFLLATAATRSPQAIARVLDGLVLGAAAVAVAGLVLLAVDHATAVVPATIEVPRRFRGFGENPNTAALLFGVVAPIALWRLLDAPSRRIRVASGVALALLFGSIVASASRGGMIAFAVGCFVTLLALWGRSRRTLVGLVAGAALIAVGVYVQALPKPTALPPAPAATTGPVTPKPPSAPRYVDVDGAYPLDNDIGRPLPGGGEPTVRRKFLGDSGRTRAWVGALHQVASRPLLGFGFGTEASVFRDRYYGFVAALPEESYIGLGLQLGVAGLLAFVALVGALAFAGARALRGARRGPAAAALGVLCAGLAAAVFQSYVYSAGSIATAAFWIAAFLLPAAAATGAE